MAMRSPRCFFNTAVALHRVFVLPTEQYGLRSASRTLPKNKPTPARISLQLQQTRCYSAPRAEQRRLPRDDQIQSWSVILVDEDGKLGEPRSKAAILADLDSAVDSLVVVAMGEPGEPPLCKIQNRLAMREAEKARTKAARAPSVTTKTIELNWAIDKGDLAHRLVKLQRFLEKSHKVEVVLAAKRKGKQATPEEAEELMRSIRARVGEVVGAREWKPIEGKLLGQSTMYFEKKGG